MSSHDYLVTLVVHVFVCHICHKAKKWNYRHPPAYVMLWVAQIEGRLCLKDTY